MKIRHFRVFLLLPLLLLGLSVSAWAVDPYALIDRESIEQALPESAQELLGGTRIGEDLDFAEAVKTLWQRGKSAAAEECRRAFGSAAKLFAVTLLCAVTAAFTQRLQPMIRITGILLIVLLAMGDLHSLLGLGSTIIRELEAFGRVLMPILAAASVASGSMNASGTVYIAVMFAIDLLVSLFAELMTPLVWADAALLTAGCVTDNKGLCKLSRALKNGVSIALKWILSLFTGYLMVAGVISGTADALTVKTVRLAVSSVIPVAGGAIADAAEAVVAGAGIVRSATGIFGILGVLAMVLLPFLRLGIQYLAFRLTALLAVVAGADDLEPILDGLSDAFSLMLALCGAAAALLLIGIFVAAAGVRV